MLDSNLSSLWSFMWQPHIFTNFSSVRNETSRIFPAIKIKLFCIKSVLTKDFMPACCDRNSKRQFSDVSDPIKHVQCNVRDKPAESGLLDTIKAKLLSAILLQIYWKIVGNIAARLIPSPIRSVAAV